MKTTILYLASFCIIFSPRTIGEPYERTDAIGQYELTGFGMRIELGIDTTGIDPALFKTSLESVGEFTLELKENGEFIIHNQLLLDSVGHWSFEKSIYETSVSLSFKNLKSGGQMWFDEYNSFRLSFSATSFKSGVPYDFRCRKKATK